MMQETEDIRVVQWTQKKNKTEYESTNRDNSVVDAMYDIQMIIMIL